ncbi:squamous cell carcinoma antigen recognized by T-cells 3 isoform X2 [Asparagus officinalis]|uniref:squamous cell carcinoma antigen recognized by T-cells 3 isoform X2 n=1 Tax=Asparagus officinalis TaxID=4686 RepID=UPI00098E040D|nr:squamous cell carcinoma antigen recognized by T-cells 3 isoform X2 [Asparagus officinalis]
MDESAAKSMEIDEPRTEAGDAERGPEPKNPSSHSSSSSSDSDSDEEGVDETQLLTLESQLQENPWNYEAHVQYIQSLRRLGHIEKLRKARESMKEHYPLTPKMWQEWAKDEVSLNRSSEVFADIEKLYECGVHEYLSVPLWCDYLNFVQECDQLVSQCAPDGILKMRSLFERALTAAGVHVVEGSKIWEAYREYEQAIFLTIGDDNNEEKSKQVDRIRTLFHRQLSIPLVDLESTLVNYRLWEVEQGNTSDMNSELDGVPANVVSAYKKALEMYNARSMYEDQLSKSDISDPDRFQSFMVLYERAVSKLPLFSELWLKYCSYLDTTLKVSHIVKDVYSRAVRNCSWVGDLWVRYLLSLERLGASEKELSAVFERSIQCVFQSFEEYLNLFLTRIDGLRRRISFDGKKEDGLHYTLIRDMFQRAADYFSAEMIRIDDLLRLYSYWARLEVTLGKDIVAARDVWESLIKKSGSILEVWQGYIEMRIGFGHINEARSLYRRCYTKRLSGTGSEEICYSWLRFEREYGTLGDFDLALSKVTPRLKELEMFKTQQEINGSSFPAKENNLVSRNVPEKRKMITSTSVKQPPSKRRKDAAPKAGEVSHADSIKNSKNKHDAEVTDKAEAATSSKSVEIDANTKQSKRNLYTDQCTAYISNINLEAKEEHLREFFSDGGGVTAIRLPKDKQTGKQRGFAYVDFSDEEHLAAAIAKNKQKMLGKKLSIARADPTQGRKKAPAVSASSDPMQGQKKAPAFSNSSRGRGRGAPFRNEHGGTSRTAKVVVTEGESEVKPIGRNTFFAAPRAVRSLAGSNKEPKGADNIEEPKSNDEFRAMLLKK